MTRTAMTDTQWKRLAELRERLRARDARHRRRVKASSRRIRWTRGDQKALAYFRRDRREPIGVEYASKLLRIPVEALLEATAREPFFLDFGRSWNGDRLLYFRFLRCVSVV
jgi:hypothetical protein